MAYWYPGVKQVIELVKCLSPNTPVILGGIYATLYPKHASENSGADFIYKGHINEHIMDALKTSGHKPGKKHLPMSYYRLGLYQGYPFAPILTSQGCPYRCSYCASSSLFDGFLQREPLEVFREIRELHEMGVRDYAFYDDALLVNINSHLKVILKEVIKLGLKIRFHCPNGIHAGLIDDELAYLMKGSGFETLRLGFETVDKKRQRDIGGKVTPELLISAVKILKRYGFTKEQIGVYLMYGLPGQPLEEVKEGVEFLKGLSVKVNLSEFSPIPGTSSWDELKRKGILDDTIDPLLTNNTVFAYMYSGYDWKDLENLKLQVKKYNLNTCAPFKFI